jgi:hypothetical protein
VLPTTGIISSTSNLQWSLHVLHQVSAARKDVALKMIAMSNAQKAVFSHARAGHRSAEAQDGTQQPAAREPQLHSDAQQSKKLSSVKLHNSSFQPKLVECGRVARR